MRDFELQETTIEPRRGKAMIWFFAIIVVVLLVRLWYLQIIQGDRLSEVALNQRTRVIPLLAPRGIIYDRHGEPLVTNRIAFTVSVLPDVASEVRKSTEGLKLLSSLLGKSENDIIKALSPERKDRLSYEPFILMEDVGTEKAMRIYEQSWRLPGVIIEKVPVRYYVHDNLASHVLGHVGMISLDELKNWSGLGYGANHKVGKDGLERYYESELKGIDGAFEIEINARQMPVRELGRESPVRGNDLFLTLDSNLQYISELTIKEKAAEVEKSSGKKMAGAAVVAIDPRNGELLAAVSYPDYNPNTYNKDFIAMNKDQRSPLLNRVLRGTYPPGSAFKPITMAGALNEKLVKVTDIFYDVPYPYGFGGWDPESGKRCKYGPHGHIDLLTGLQYSCNVPFYLMGKDLGIDRLSKYSREFGLGEKTGIDLFPEEYVGLVPDRQWKRDSFKRADDKVWYAIETLDVAIGQGATKVTPLQMAVAYSAIANGGTVYQPFVVKEIRNTFGEVVREFTPVIKREMTLSKSTLAILREGLEKVTSRGGTGARAFADFPIKVAGKTGSAESPGKESHAWFIGYAPADKPEICILVMIENGGTGGGVAAPIARTILERYFNHESDIATQTDLGVKDE